VRVIRTALFIVLTLAVACADESAVETSGSCLKAHGKVVDVDQEADRSAEYVKRWGTEDGCAVRLDRLLSRMGPDSCGGDSTADVEIYGTLARELFERAKGDLTYVRDPANVFGDDSIASLFEESAAPPRETRDSGYRQGHQELWLDPADHAFIYLVDSDATERWPLDPNPPGCA